VTLWVGVIVVAVVSVDWPCHRRWSAALDAGELPSAYGCGLTAGRLCWALSGGCSRRAESRRKSPQLAERWSLVAKIAMALVAVSGFAIAWENVGSIPNCWRRPMGAC
jgi:putative copper resistance protein D